MKDDFINFMKVVGFVVFLYKDIDFFDEDMKVYFEEVDLVFLLFFEEGCL